MMVFFRISISHPLLIFLSTYVPLRHLFKHIDLLKNTLDRLYVLTALF